ncbi:MAG TPA: nuclear transport factor 2 family protein [Pyrinomonadaceae bacterium]|nr:nuclear transport factor 2 family protein [Pyrinomonadaceae bacterium]
MFRKIYLPGFIGILLLAAIGFAVGFTISNGWVQHTSGSTESAALIPLASERESDGLRGPANRVRTETAKLSLQSGKLVEGSRELLESTTYDHQGKRTDNAYYLVSSNSQLGREEYVRDAQGNLGEKTVRDNNNRILSKEVYTYEYDAVGNWVKMITSTVIYDAGKVTQQPTEVTYRNITYYFDQAIADIVKTGPASAVDPADERHPKGDFASLRGSLDEWVAATNARDLERLMRFYSPEVEAYYRARNVSQDFVRADRVRLFQRSDSIKVSVAAPEITIGADEIEATMRFRKSYVMTVQGRERHGEVLQLLQWRRTDAGWKITGERDIKVIRRD